MKSNKIDSPFVLEFILSFLDFPSELAQYRLVSRPWNKAVLRAVNYQLKHWEEEVTRFRSLKQSETRAKQLQEFQDITKLVRKSEEKGHFFVKVRQIGNMPRPHSTYFHFTQLLAVFLGKPGKLQKWEEAAKIYKDPHFFDKMQKVHVQRQITLKKVEKFKYLITGYPTKLNYPFLRKCSFKIATLFQYMSSAIDFFMAQIQDPELYQLIEGTITQRRCAKLKKFLRDASQG